MLSLLLVYYWEIMKIKQDISDKEMLVREILGRVADKWTLLVIDALEEKEMRFVELQREIGEISQKMLTKTLRQLERDGLVTRKVYPTVPPRVDYKITSRGKSLGASVCAIWTWVEGNMAEIEKSRESFDSKKIKKLIPAPTLAKTSITSPEF